jgi:hypothetical protein
MYWVYGGIAILLFTIFIPTDNVFIFTGLGYLLAWYVLFAQQQEKYVHENLGGIYDKKGWEKPLGIAVVGFIGFLIVADTIVTNYDSEFQKDSALEGISGVWRANTDGTMITFKVSGKIKSIEVNGKSLPVSVKGYDDVNKITTLIVNSTPSAILSIRQLFDYEGRFTLKLTSQDGREEELSFVRSL